MADIDRIINIFQRFDRNGDGTISRDEFASVFRAVDKNAWDDQKLDALMKAADTNRDGKISYREFVDWVMSEYSATIDLKDEDALDGFEIQSSEGDKSVPEDALRLTGLPAGLVAWSNNTTDTKVGQNDEIIGVNKVCGKSQELKNEIRRCMQAEESEMTLRLRKVGVIAGVAGVNFPKAQRAADGSPVPAWRWGITKKQLADLHRECKANEKWSDADSIADFVEKFVKPMTDGTWMGTALLLNKDSPKQVNLMVSHAWSENAGRFFEDLDRHMRDDEVAFICALALYQQSYEAIGAQLGDDLASGPFGSVIHSVKTLGGRMLVVPNEELKVNGQGLYSRMWCDWEVYFAKTMRLPIEFTHRNSAEYLFGEGGQATSCRDARCGNPALPMNKDEGMIREQIESGFISFQTTDAQGNLKLCSKGAGRIYRDANGKKCDAYETVDRVIKEAAGIQS